MKFNNGWSHNKKRWYNKELEKRDPAKFKEVRTKILGSWPLSRSRMNWGGGKS